MSHSQLSRRLARSVGEARGGDAGKNGLYLVSVGSQKAGKATRPEGMTMSTLAGTTGRSISRRQFLSLAGAGAVVGALILAATQKKGLQGILKTVSSGPTNQATAGKFIRTSAPAAGPSFLQRLLGGKL